MRKLIARSAVLIYIVSTFFFYNAYAQKAQTAGADLDAQQTDQQERKVSATDLGVMCINTSYPSMGIQLADSRDNENPQETDGGSGAEATAPESETGDDPVVTGDEPLVLIVHTHATESYLPQSGGNFHSKDEENTVRDVGNVLAAPWKNREYLWFTIRLFTTIRRTTALTADLMPPLRNFCRSILP